MNFLFLDLEFNQPSQRIIQYGYCVGNPVTGELVTRGGDYVTIFQEQLDPFIIELTGITQSQVDKGVTLTRVLQHLNSTHQQYNCFRNLVTYGGDDTRALRKATQYLGEEWPFGDAYIDVKTVYRTWKLATGSENLRGGLARALTHFNMSFSGRKHNAIDDAYNTFRLYTVLVGYIGKLPNYYEMPKSFKQAS